MCPADEGRGISRGGGRKGVHPRCREQQSADLSSRQQVRLSLVPLSQKRALQGIPVKKAIVLDTGLTAALPILTAEIGQRSKGDIWSPTG